MEINRVFIGQFDNESGSFAISDPCYGTDVWCRGVLNHVKVGTWNAEVGIADRGDFGLRVALLNATHESYDEYAEGDLTEHHADFEVGVDSGQAGIFDAAHYKGGDDEEWYQLCCNATLNSEHFADVIPFGAVSSSGYGDGSYDCIYYTDLEGVIVKVTIAFLI